MARDEIDEAGAALATAPVENTENTEAAPVVGTPDAPEAVSTEPPATVPASTEPTEPAKPAGPSAEEIEAALVAFMKLADEVSGRRDVASGDPSETDVAQVVESYKKLPGTGVKTRVRNALAERMNAALQERLDASEARSYMQLGLAIKSAGAARETVAKVPVDPTEAFVAQLAAMLLAPNLVKVPDGVSAEAGSRAMALISTQEIADQVGAYKVWLDAKATWDAADEATRGEAPAEPEVNDLVKAAARIARGRAGAAPRAARTATTSTRTTTSGYAGPPRNVIAHILNAFDGKPVGTFMKIGEIAAVQSAEYGDERPSSGAVTARLFPTAEGKAVNSKILEGGIEPTIEGGIKGARKVA